MKTATAPFGEDRLRASAIHFAISLVVALLAGLVVFGLWFPYPYREISGGRELFLILTGVDVILGPLVTLAIFNRGKPWRLLRMDLAVVAVLQASALAYGLWTVFLARPAHLVFEYNRFRVVHVVDIPPELLKFAPPNLDSTPLTGPTMLALRPFRNSQEKMEMTVAALNGLSLSARPELWEPYTAAIDEIRQTSKPVVELKARFPSQVEAIDATLKGRAGADSDVRYLPLAGRKVFWTVLVDGRNGDILGFLPLDSF